MSDESGDEVGQRLTLRICGPRSAPLNTDYIDLLHQHVWDFTTPVEEILRGLDDLVRQGKILYVAISNAPAWQVARMQTIADLRVIGALMPAQLEGNPGALEV